MIVQHLALVDRLHGVQLVLHLRLEVRPDLLHLATVLHAVDHDEGDQDGDGHDAAEHGDHGGVGAGRLVPHRRVVQSVVLGVDLAAGEDLAHGARVLGQADAGEGVVAVLAEAAVQTRVGIALVHLLGAVLACEARPAGALEVVDSIGAGSTVGTRGVLAVVIVVLALPSDEPVLTHALKVVDEGEADPLVLTRRVFAQIRHLFTVAALEAGGTRARVSGHVGHARGSVLTRVVFGADVEVGGELAVRPVEPRRAAAGVIIVQPSLKQSKNS